MSQALEKAMNVASFKLNAIQKAFIRDVKQLGNLQDQVEAQKETIRKHAKGIKARTPEGMAAVALGVLELYAGKCKVTPQLGLDFSNAAAQTWYGREIAPLLPAVRVRNAKPKRLTADQLEEKEERETETKILRLARRIRLARDEQGLKPAQIKEAIRIGLGRGEI